MSSDFNMKIQMEQYATVRSMTLAYSQALQLAESASKALSLINDTFVVPSEQLINTFRTLSNTAVTEFIRQLNRGAKELCDALSYASKFLVSLDLSEEQRNNIKTVAKRWGELGWSMPPNAPIVLSRKIPPEEEVDTLMLSYCGPKEMDQIFEEIKSKREIPLGDFEDAISLFKLEQYKACALLLFSLMDGCVLQAQPPKTKRSEPNRKHGSKGIQVLLKDENNDQLFERISLFVRPYLMFLHAYESFYKPGDDFKEQPIVINRNFISHGMLAREVTRKDCVQVFLLFYNQLMYMNDRISFIKV